jgi:2-dehydropantoate 2-reductase
LPEVVDVLWVTPKATHLLDALQAVPDPGLAKAVVPLLNGVDHVAVLRERFGPEAVLPATIAAELERRTRGQVVHRSPFVRFGFSARGETVLRRSAGILTGFGATCWFEPDETSLLWRKLAMLAPMALTTTAYARTLGEIREDPALEAELEAAIREAGAVARAEGAQVDVEQTLGFLRAAPGGLRSSMQKDVEAGRAPELDAIGGPVVRGAGRHGLEAPVTAALMERIRTRA